MSKVGPDDVEASKTRPSAADELEPLTAESVEITVDPAKRRIATMTVLISTFIDLACAVILQPSHPMMCSNAAGALRPGGWPEGYSHPQAFPGAGMPAYQWSVSLLLVGNQVGQAISNAILNPLSDKYGRRPVMLVCTFMGSVSLAGYFIAGTVIQNYWAYLGVQILNGLFGAMKSVGQNYIQDINEPADFVKLQPLLIVCFTFGAVGGGLIGGVVSSAAKVDDRSGNLFAGALIGCVGELICFLALFFFAPEAPRKKKSAAAKGNGKKERTAAEKRNAAILWTLVIAGAFDAFGDNGNTFARNVIFSNRYEEGKDASWQAILLVLKSVGVFVAMMTVVKSAKKIRMPMWTIIGNLFSGFCQYGIIPHSMPLAGFVVIWTTSQCFGFTSTMANIFLLPAFAPPASRGFWMGINSSLLMLMMASAPLTLSGVYSAVLAASPSDFAKAEMTCLLVCGSISLLAAVLYSRLLFLVPKPKPPAPLEPSEEEMEAALQLDDKSWARLGAPLRNAANAHAMASGRGPKIAHWVSYEDDLADNELISIARRASDNFTFIEKTLKDMVKDQAALEKTMRDGPKTREFLNKNVDIERERAVMGKWMTDYLDDAGYHQWVWFPDTFKAMIMNAFPALDKLDNKKVNEKPQFETDPEAFKQYFVRFTAAVRRHSALTNSEENKAALESLAVST